MQLLGAMKSYYYSYYSKIITLSYVQRSLKEANVDLWVLCIKEVYGQHVGF